jgi:glycosyltransferase involved in cell wall biosynthesis
LGEEWAEVGPDISKGLLVYVSVIICAYNQRELLRQALLSLAQQSHDHYEVVIADDGSTDGTSEMVRALEPPYPMHYFWQENKGRAAARNLGFRQARGDLLLFLDGDMIADPCLLEEHIKTHLARDQVMVMGMIRLSPSLVRTLFTKRALYSYLDEVMDANGYLPAPHCTTGNLSIKRKDMMRIGDFDESFKVYGWEDTDFGYRAEKMGLRLLYNPHAISYHCDYAADLRRACERQRWAARAAQTLFVKHPELRNQLPMFRDKGYMSWHDDPPHIILRKLARSIMILPPALKMFEGITSAVEALWPSPVLLRPLYRWVIGTYICLGYREGLKARHG